MNSSPDQTIAEILGRCREDPARFNRCVLGRGPYWSRQIEACRSLVKYRTTCVYSGNGIGKSFLAAGVIAWAATCHPGSKTVVAAPTQSQLTNVVWAELTAAHRASTLPLGGKLKGLQWDLGPNWSVEGYGQGSIESKSGRHTKDLFAVIDEASGVSAQVFEAIDSLNPSRVLLLGNPIRPQGRFYDLCTRPSPHVNAIHVSSLEGPHAHLERSHWGMADRTWLEAMAADWGTDSLWYRVHVLGLFPDSADDALIPRDWLDLAAVAIHVPSGPRRMAVDLAKGNGGDRSVILVRDDDGVLAIEHSDRWALEATAARVAVLALDFGVQPARITFDASNLGADFANRLARVGIHGAKGYMGSHSGGDQYGSLRDACHWSMRRRLDPGRGRPPAAAAAAAEARTSRPPGVVVQRVSLRDGLAGAKADGSTSIYVPQPPFAIGRDHMSLLRPELQALNYSLDDAGRIRLETKDQTAKALRHSPDFSDALAMSFAYPNT